MAFSLKLTKKQFDKIKNIQANADGYKPIADICGVCKKELFIMNGDKIIRINVPNKTKDGIYQFKLSDNHNIIHCIEI